MLLAIVSNGGAVYASSAQCLQLEFDAESFVEQLVFAGRSVLTVHIVFCLAYGIALYPLPCLEISLRWDISQTNDDKTKRIAHTRHAAPIGGK